MENFAPCLLAARKFACLFIPSLFASTFKSSRCHWEAAFAHKERVLSHAHTFMSTHTLHIHTHPRTRIHVNPCSTHSHADSCMHIAHTHTCSHALKQHTRTWTHTHYRLRDKLTHRCAHQPHDTPSHTHIHINTGITHSHTQLAYIPGCFLFSLSFIFLLFPLGINMGKWSSG